MMPNKDPKVEKEKMPTSLKEHHEDLQQKPTEARRNQPTSNSANKVTQQEGGGGNTRATRKLEALRTFPRNCENCSVE
ncbi:hypothetical protein C1H46_037079 [Malus baccata]|uniref:Uncharacterized protein n=1 Tax=Malus baccata TaxID=106549 RepID=A0A540KTC5_MALBA|nr:hypothetical protein C1H46_037079 [Malus baccata]